ncbi:MAG: hypothetical protein FWH48_11925 [Oscillospiraceae bacterium]|nr:hypothetical protein [Oscillospiraceae bacterium]
MARGQQLDTQTVYNIMASYSATGNYSETARELELPTKTVESTVKKNRDKEEFIELRTSKKQEFSEKCSEIIDMLLDAIKKKAETLLSDDMELGKAKLTDISTTMGTVYDKRALALGESTDNITFALPEEVKRYAE